MSTSKNLSKIKVEINHTTTKSQQKNPVAKKLLLVITEFMNKTKI